MKISTRIVKSQYFILLSILFMCLIPIGCGRRGMEQQAESVSRDSEPKTENAGQLDDGYGTEGQEASAAASQAVAKETSESEAKESEAKETKTKESETKEPETDSEFKALEQEVSDMIDYMTIEEKAAQLFIVYPESLVEGVPCVTMAGEATKESIERIPVGGVLYMSQNLGSPEQVKEMLKNIQTYSMDRINLPIFLCVDEEGGQIARIANNNSFAQDNVGDMSEIGQLGDVGKAYTAGVTIGSYLSELGFNLDFAPVADVSTYAYGAVIGKRAFSDDPKVVADMSAELSRGLESQGIISVYKHFPGHGSTIGDPHNGYAYTDKTLEELTECDLVPFQNGIKNEASMIMVGHISLPQILADGTPASLSKEIMTDLLRNSMNYDGVIVTDAMNMGAINDKYDSDEAAVLAFNAGADIILMPKDFSKAYNGILEAIADGRITEDAVDESLRRILRLKIKLKDGKLQ